MVGFVYCVYWGGGRDILATGDFIERTEDSLNVVMAKDVCMWCNKRKLNRVASSFNYAVINRQDSCWLAIY